MDAVMLDAVPGFIREASALQRKLRIIHLGEETDGPTDTHEPDTLLQAADDLCVAIGRLEDPIANNAAPVAISACRSVARDLRCHLVCLDECRQVQPPNALDYRRVIDLWPYPDVKALGERLHNLSLLLRDKSGSLLNSSGSLDVQTQSPGGTTDNIDVSIKDALHPDTSAKLDTATASVAETLGLSSLDSQRQYVRNEILESFLLDALVYSSMRSREQEVVAAHEDTFYWIYDKSDDVTSKSQSGVDFRRWLSSDDLGSIYWISGKPGSGKSTLMRFLYEENKTKKILESWAGSQSVSMAGFFFWTSGSQEQRSQTGLLRSLLHQLLSANEALVPWAFPELWRKLSKMTTKARVNLTLEWTATDLIIAFQRFMETALERMNICLFIDGLDEFEGDHMAMIGFLRGLVEGKKGHKLKLCLSSRPWKVFETAFQQAVPNLKLQDLSCNDMVRYTVDRLLSDKNVCSVAKSHPEFTRKIVQETVKKADGVFLWVRLAVDRMLEEFAPTVNLGGLEVIVQSLPGDLDDLFEKLLFEDRTANQISETACLFELMQARATVAEFIKDESYYSLNVWEIAFAMNDIDDSLFLTAQVEQIAASEIDERIFATRSYTHSAFRGLLDIHENRMEGRAWLSDLEMSTTAKVKYIHRTVRDWLLGPREIAKRLQAYTPSGFNAHLRLFRSYVLRLKRPLEEPEKHRRINEWWLDIALSMTHARLANDAVTPVSLRHLVNEIDKTLSWYWVPRGGELDDHWARYAFGTYEIRKKAAPITEPFLKLATKFGLTEYVKMELAARDGASSPVAQTNASAINEEDDISVDESAPLLSYATEFLCSRDKTIFPLSNPALIQILLSRTRQKKQDPNHEYKDFVSRKPRTPWIALLRHLRDARRRGWIDYYDYDPEGTPRWTKVVALFVEYGADKDAVIVADRWDPEITAKGVLDLLVETYHSADIELLRKQLDSK